MRIEPKAFLAIEQSMAGAMRAQWDKLATDIVTQLHAALQAGDYAKAQEIANRLTMDGVVKNVRPRLEELAVSALLFGAHRVTGDVTETIYAKGEPAPATLHNALTQLEHAVEVDAADYVRRAVHAIIEEQKRSDDHAHMQKHDIYTEPDKRPDAQAAEQLPDIPDPDKETVLAQEKLFGQAKWQYPDLKKDSDVSDAQLAATGGLQEPEQAAPKKKRKQTLTKAAETKTLAERINDCVVNGGTVAVDLGASLTTSRLITLGFLSQASTQSISRYRVDEVLDGKTCPVCRFMHGKVFNVADQLSRTVQALSTQDPEDLKTVAPWPSQSAAGIADLSAMSNGDLQSAGLGSPPYHAGCRGMLSFYGTEEQDVEPSYGADALDLAQQIMEGVGGDEAAGAAAAEPSEDAGGAAPEPGEWDSSAVEQLGWERFNVTDPEVFQEVDDAFEAKDYDKAQQLIDSWKSHQEETQKAEDAIPPSDNEGFEGPNAGKKKRKLQTPAAREQDYDDIAPDSSSIAFDARVMNENGAPLDRV